MKVFKLIFKNALRHKLRTTLTVLGIAVAVIAFGLLRTVVTVWNSSIDVAAPNRLITRQAVSFIFPLPYSYLEKIKQVPGVSKVTFATWFQGVYKDKQYFFARLAMDAETMFDVYPELLISKEEVDNFKRERNACVIGIETAKTHKLKIGDRMTLDGDIYPGKWDFVIRGIYKPKFRATDATQMFFHWEMVDERMKVESPDRAGWIGWYVVQISDPAKSAEISNRIDALFKNSPAETKTESEKAFTENFMSSMKAIFTSMNFMSFAIVGIIMLVLANTMIMSARERTREYAVLKTLGFSGIHIIGLILGESLFISAIGGGIGLLLLYPIAQGFDQTIPKNFFPYFELEAITLILSVSASLLIGVLSAIFPIQKALRTKIVEGFRFVG
jgi:putative ABC transport system permease protein